MGLCNRVPNISTSIRIFAIFVSALHLRTMAVLCNTCSNALKRNHIPAQAKCNGLQLLDIPAVLSKLNELEVRLISQHIPFMKIVALPCGKQRCIHGPAVNVPTSTSAICQLLLHNWSLYISK